MRLTTTPQDVLRPHGAVAGGERPGTVADEVPPAEPLAAGGEARA